MPAALKQGMSRTRDGCVKSYPITILKEGPLVIFVSPQDQQLKEQRYKITRKMKGFDLRKILNSCPAV